MKQWTRIIANWRDETFINDTRANFVYNVILDFTSEQQALNFRETFKDKDSYYYHTNDNPYNIKFKILNEDYDDKIKLYKDDIEKMRGEYSNSWLYKNKLPLNTTHFEFQISVEVEYKFEQDNNGLEQQIKQLLKQDFEQKHNAKVQIQFIPPKMNDLKDYQQPSYKILDKKDTLFEGLSASELKHYDFIIVGRTQEEVDKLTSIYINQNRYSTHFWNTKIKEDIKKDDYYNKRNDMSYLKTKSDILDSGIYCFTTRARNYFSYYKDKMLLPVFLDAKASQLGGKVVVAKKINKWKIKKSNYFDNYTENIRKKKYIESLKNEICEKLGIIKEDLDNKNVEQLEEMLDNIQ